MEEELISIFKESVDGEISVINEFGGNTHFISYNDDFDNYELRYKIFNGEVIISRVNLGVKRNGIFTKIMKVFVNHKDEFNIHSIRIQSVLTDAMYKWCLKNGYTEVGNGFEGVLRGDFVKEI